MKDITVKDCTYRIYCDLRFSRDKKPYKTHFGAYVCPQGKKSGYAGYYIHIQPEDNLFMLCSGLYMPSSGTVKSVREEIMTNGDEFASALAECKDFELDWNLSTKRVPKGYNADDEHSDYYRLKDYSLIKKIDLKTLLKHDFLETALNDFRKTLHFNKIMNRCVDYAREMGW